jgi:hypothetical protein
VKDSRIVSIRLPAALVEAAQAAAKQEGTSRHRLLQLALVDALADLDVLPPATR